jgi:hypothetical protein
MKGAGVMRRAFVAMVAALLAAVAGPAGPVAADSGAPGWRPSGAEVQGATDAADAPVLDMDRLYRDTLGAGEAKAYRVHLDAASSAYLSAFAVPGMDASVRPIDGIRLELKSADDTVCDTYQAMFGARDAARPVGGYVTRSAGTDAECRSAGWYVLWVTRNSTSGPDSGDWPLEIRYTWEPALIPGPAPRPAVGYSTASPTPVTGNSAAVEGGSGLDDAAALRTGVWKDSVQPGRTLFYKVRADWGQQVALVADFDEATERAQHPFGVSTGRVEMYSPMRGYVADDTAPYTGQTASAWLRTAPISYGNRLDGRRAVSAARVAGWYYFAVSVDARAADFVRGTVPLTLRVDVSGKAVPGPAYAGASSDGAADGAGGSAAAHGSGTSGGARSTALRIVGFTALGTGSLLVVSLALWTAVARRQYKAARTAP